MILRKLISTLVRPINLCRIPATRSFVICLRKSNFCSIQLLDSNIRRLTTYKSRNKSTETDTDPESCNESKAKLISLLNFESAKDALPFYNLPVKTLLHIYKTTMNDVENGHCRNRLYYLSKRIECPASVVSQRLAKRTFIYSLSFDWLKSSLDVLLEMGVTGDRILRDLWVLKYRHDTIQERLQRVKNLGIDSLYPWMVRCSEDILNRFITISQETKHILGDNKSTQVYIANRLNVSLDLVEDMCAKVPSLKSIRVTKVKNFLDFLIKEGFELEDIANKPRVLTASQKTVEQRLQKLRKHGIPISLINLNILSRSKKDFNKYFSSVQSVSEMQN